MHVLDGVDHLLADGRNGLLGELPVAEVEEVLRTNRAGPTTMGTSEKQNSG